MTFPRIIEYQGDLIDTLMKMASTSLRCQYIYCESTYGSGDSQMCGRDAVGYCMEDETPRCRLHMGD